MRCIVLGSYKTSNNMSRNVLQVMYYSSGMCELNLLTCLLDIFMSPCPVIKTGLESQITSSTENFLLILKQLFFLPSSPLSTFCYLPTL